MRVRNQKVITGVASAVCTTTLTIAMTGCGTALITNNFSMTVVDSSGEAPESIQVSIFDSTMGASAEWAGKSQGTTTPTKPYTTSFKSTATKVVGDNGPSEQVAAGIAFPLLVPKGYFALTIKPIDGQTTTVQAPFVGYYDYNAATDGTPGTLPVEVTSQAGDLSWTLTIKAKVPGSTSVLVGP